MVVDTATRECDDGDDGGETCYNGSVQVGRDVTKRTTGRTEGSRLGSCVDPVHP